MLVVGRYIPSFCSCVYETLYQSSGDSISNSFSTCARNSAKSSGLVPKPNCFKQDYLVLPAGEKENRKKRNLYSG